MNKIPAIGKQVALILLAFIVAILITAVISLFSHTPEDTWSNIPLPDVTHQPLALRVVYARNPRFPDLTAQQLQQVLQRTAELMQQHFNLHVAFEISASIDVAVLFAALPDVVKKHRVSSIVDPRFLDQQSLTQMRNSLFEQLSNYAGDPQNLLDYAQPNIVNNESITDMVSLARALSDTHVTRLRYWYEEKAADGNPIIDGSAYNQWVWWDSLGYSDLPYDVVITNQLVASLETYDVAMHSALRGGINGGTMTYSKQGRYGGYVFVSVFALINDMPMLASLRDDKHYSDEQITDYTAATLAHELGHLFKHYDHPFGAAECLMNPTALLHYRAWYSGLNAEACNAKQLPQMQAGAARISYNTNW